MEEVDRSRTGIGAVSGIEDQRMATALVGVPLDGLAGALQRLDVVC